MTHSTAYDEYPQHRLEIDDQRVALRVSVDGEVIAETKRGLNLHEGRYPDVVYVPREDVRMDRLTSSDHITHCPFKGDASYFDYRGDYRENVPAESEGASEHPQIAWSYESPFDQMEAIRDHLAFYADRATLEVLSD
jgi:uncharacterized protein (DUF427 family)